MAEAAPGGANRESLSFAEARERVLAAAGPLGRRLGTERVPLLESVGRVLAADLLAPSPFPRFDNTAVDGYACRAADLRGAVPERPVRLAVIEIVPAGRAPTRSVGAGESARVMTGAPIPGGADTVVKREDTEEGEGEVRVGVSLREGENVRPAGEDLGEGDRLLEAGRIVTAGDLALLGGFGRDEVEVVRRPRVGILSTGDELRLPGETLGAGEIYDSNSFVLSALVAEAGAEPAPVVRVRDDARAVAGAIRELASTSDLVLSLGGVSAGDFDPVKQALAELPEVALWRVAMRPGGPQAFGRVGEAIFYGLPGNPVSSAVVFDRLARVLLRAAMGATEAERRAVIARLVDGWISTRGRRDFLRVRLEGEPGTYLASLTGTQSSGALSSLSRADGLAVVPEDVDEIERGGKLDVILWRAAPGN